MHRTPSRRRARVSRRIKEEHNCVLDALLGGLFTCLILKRLFNFNVGLSSEFISWVRDMLTKFENTNPRKWRKLSVDGVYRPHRY